MYNITGGIHMSECEARSHSYLVQCSLPITPLRITTNPSITTKGSKTDASFQISKTPLNTDHSKITTAFCLQFMWLFLDGNTVIEINFVMMCLIFSYNKHMLQCTVITISLTPKQRNKYLKICLKKQLWCSMKLITQVSLRIVILVLFFHNH